MLDFPRWKIAIILLICFGALLVALPNALQEDTRDALPDFLPKETVALGLDLRGGSYLLLEVDVQTYMQEQAEQLLDEVRTRLRKERIGYRGLSIRKEEVGAIPYVSFTLRDSSDGSRLSELFGDLNAEVSLDITDGESVILTYRSQAIETMTDNVVKQSIEIVRRRVDETGTREPIIQRQGEQRILLQVPGLDSPEELKRLLGKTAKLTFHLMDEDNPFPGNRVRPKPGIRLLEGDDNDGRLYLVKRRVMLSGDQLVDARSAYDNVGRPAVNFRFNNQGGRIFGQVTKENIKKPFAIVLDGVVITAPVIQVPILSGNGQITGNFTVQEAHDLALLLRAGALPAPLKVLEERSVGPSLGQDSIEAGKMAAMLAVALVVVLMMVFYGLFGVFSNIALVCNLLLVVAALTLFGATLTLPGIAGMVLTMGMAVDANVLIFERIKEEARVGKTPYAAVEHGFRQAFKTILDSNITTLIAAVILFIYGTGPVKGFAVTLSIGILASMFSAVLLTRMLVVLWLHRRKPSTLPL